LSWRRTVFAYPWILRVHGDAFRKKKGGGGKRKGKEREKEGIRISFFSPYPSHTYTVLEKGKIIDAGKEEGGRKKGFDGSQIKSFSMLKQLLSFGVVFSMYQGKRRKEEKRRRERGRGGRP